MSLNCKDLLNLMYYSKLPQVYRDADSELGDYPLKRYLQSLIEGGFCASIEDIEGVQSFIDPNKIPDKFLPYLLDSFGIGYYPDIDMIYQRKILANIGEVIRRRGTYSGVKYIVRVLTGLDCTMYMDDNLLFSITIHAPDLESFINLHTNAYVLQDYIKKHVPFFINVDIELLVDSQNIQGDLYSHSIVGVYKEYSI